MKRNLNTTLTSLDGTPLKTGATIESLSAVINALAASFSAEQVAQLQALMAEHAGRELSLASTCCNALLAAHEDERALSGEDKVKRWKLAQRIHDATGEIDIASEEVSLLKTLLAKSYTPLVVGQAWSVLESDPAAEPMAGRT